MFAFFSVLTVVIVLAAVVSVRERKSVEDASNEIKIDKALASSNPQEANVPASERLPQFSDYDSDARLYRGPNCLYTNQRGLDGMIVGLYYIYVANLSVERCGGEWRFPGGGSADDIKNDFLASGSAVTIVRNCLSPEAANRFAIEKLGRAAGVRADSASCQELEPFAQRVQKLSLEMESKQEVPVRPDKHETESTEAPEARTSANRPDPTYTAIVSCGLSGDENVNVLGCFAGNNKGSPDTEIEITNGGQYGLYKAYQISSLGAMTQRGLEIKLASHFDLTAQNSSDVLILGVRIIDDSTGQQVFIKQVSQFGVIKISN